MEKQFYNIESLKAIPISKVVERWGGHLRRVGCRQVTHCPWHEDEHPSLTLYETGGENRCYCFACGQGGCAIDYVMAKEGTDFKGACERLAGTFGGGGLVVGSPCVQSVQSGRQKEEKEVVYVPREWVEQRVSVENSFCKCLMLMFDRHLVEHLTEEYLIGCYDNGVHEDCVLFPSIDVEGRVRNVKVQHYCTDPQSAQFAHGDKRCCYWLGTTLAREGVVAADGRFDNECLFGEHLLRRYPSQAVALVESPKNALFGAAVQPDYLWIATGNKSMLKRPLMERLRGRQVMVFPDRDAIGEWTALLHGMRDIATFSVSDFSDRFAAQGDAKYDIADYVVERFLEDV
ncbi:MAG: hypothetical protein IJR02_01310 [Bacteroidaceae bacterium]|nr:hypothetical protein [Bacteroidaceae bacterium]